MAPKFSLWTFLTTALCLVASSLGEIQPHSIAPDSALDDKDAVRYVLLPRILSLLSLRAQQENWHDKSLSESQRLLRLLKIIERGNNSNEDTDQQQKKKRKFPEIDSRGFDEDIFDEGFGDWSPMKRW